MSTQDTRLPRAGAEPVVLSVIAPCFNEQDNVELLTARTLGVFEEMGIAAQLLLVDDGSTDATWERIEQCSRGSSQVHGIRHVSNRGMEAAWHSGLEGASGELVCLIDADLQNRPEDIPRLYRAYLRELPDLVQGIRHPVSGARHRHLFSRGLNLLLNLTFRMSLRDSKSGFVLCRRDVLPRLLRHRFEYRYYQSFIGVAAHTQCYTIAEVNTDFDKRHAGDSFLARFPFAVSLRICWELMKFKVETRSSAHRAARKPGKWSIPPALAKTAHGEM